MKPSDNCYKCLRQFEGKRLKAYKDSAGIWTIGYGTTFYPDGATVKQHDSITIDRADFLLKWQALTKSGEVDKLVKNVSQNQFDALVCFAYNVGSGALKKSTLLKKLLANPNDPTIETEFLKWNKVKKQVVDPEDQKKKIWQYVEVDGLTKRRQAESDLYFTP